MLTPKSTLFGATGRDPAPKTLLIRPKVERYLTPIGSRTGVASIIFVRTMNAISFVVKFGKRLSVWQKTEYSERSTSNAQCTSFCLRETYEIRKMKRSDPLFVSL
ncbi:hypothetical protein Tsubulata_029403 [Turnera subulata]|uniref:Uncharacterized protein n=1 Tax=Turnera subulata TaxID=218843 RepID=A0A9Q0F6C1_9ROSI|nr:hypothetical protein Tsubulata_029403 [Turnera subulata]